MLKKKLGIEAIEIDWHNVFTGIRYEGYIEDFFKVSSTLIIPKGCVRVGEYAFWGCMELKRVIIPKSVKVIERSAFDGCKYATIVLRKCKGEFEWIGSFAFNECRDVKEELEIVGDSECELREVTIPEGCEWIESEAFWGCRELEKVVIPRSVKEIGDHTFAYCKNLKEAVIPESVEYIGEGAFKGCEKATIILRKRKEDFEEIGNGAFKDCKDVKEEVRS